MRMSRPIEFLFRQIMAPTTGDEGGGGGAEETADEALEEHEADESPTDEADDESTGDDDSDEAAEAEELGDAPKPDDDAALTVTIDGEEAGGAEDDEDLSEMTPKARKRWAEMRIQLRNEKRARKEAEDRAVAKQAATAAEVEDPGPEPKIDDEDVDYDAEKFSEKYRTWTAKSSEAAKVKERRQQAQEQDHKEWQTRLESYQKHGYMLSPKAFSEAEEATGAALSVVQRGIIIRGMKEPAKVMLALGQSPKHLAKIAAIKDPVEFACEVARLETKMTVEKRKAPPAPERVLKSSTSGAAAVDNQLERLREAARKSGDYNKVAEYKRQQQEKTRKRAAA